jgi:hypothetical protein
VALCAAAAAGGVCRSLLLVLLVASVRPLCMCGIIMYLYVLCGYHSVWETGNDSGVTVTVTPPGARAPLGCDDHCSASAAAGGHCQCGPQLSTGIV